MQPPLLDPNRSVPRAPASLLAAVHLFFLPLFLPACPPEKSFPKNQNPTRLAKHGGGADGGGGGCHAVPAPVRQAHPLPGLVSSLLLLPPLLEPIRMLLRARARFDA